MRNEIIEKISKGSKNLIVEGGLSSGKTTNVLFPIVDEIIEKKESLLLLDSKEEYLNKYYNKLKESGYNTLVINLRDPKNSEGWNPLSYPYDLFKSGDVDYAQEQIEKIGKTIFYSPESMDPFWSETAKDFFTGVVLGLMEDAKREEVNFNSINNMFNGVGKKYGAKDYINAYFDNKGVNSKPYIFASSTILAPNETKGGILSTARQKLRLYISRENLTKLLSESTFEYKDITSKPTALIVIGRDDSEHYINQIVSLFIEQLYAYLVDSKSNTKMNLVLDNFDSIEKCLSIIDILSSGISRNIKTYIATRSLEALANKYDNSINYLCDLVRIKNDSVEIVVNNIETSVDKHFENVTIPRVDIDIKELKNKEIKVFSLEDYVHKNVKLPTPGLPLKPNELPKMENPFNVDDLIKKIDDKIDEIEKEEKKNNKDSVFESFKI